MTNWTDDRIETLKALWHEGLSASQVAHALGNVTRNAVIGKVHRLGLAARANAPRAIHPRVPAAPRLRAPTHCKPVVAVIEHDPFKFEDGSFATMRTIGNSMCRWPIGDPSIGEFHFCGCNAKPGSPYCEAHALRAHQPHRKAAATRKSAPRYAHS
jgi:GcrA cell cycle regulator